MEDKINGYKELIRIIEDYNLDDMQKVKIDAEKRIFAFEFLNKYNIEIDPNKLSINNGVIWTSFYTPFGDIYLGTYGNKYNRTVTNNKQDVDEEVLLHISFPTGAYIFGEDYPKEFFAKFYSELKSYNPKYCDDLNKGLYFSMDNATNIFNDYRNICKKYIDENRNDCKQRKIKELREEADRLESTINEKK
jgi:hypothetical protein